MESREARKYFGELVKKRYEDQRPNADIIAGLAVIAETIRDGFVLVARAIRPSQPDPEDY